MDKYTDVIYKHPHVVYNIENFMSQCIAQCYRTQTMFDYPPKFTIKCGELCVRLNEDYKVYITGTKTKLEKGITICESRLETEEIKACIKHHQEETFKDIKEKSEEFRDKFL